MSSNIEFAVMLSTFGDHASPEAFRRVATAAEEQDFDAVWAGDHISFPAKIPAEYPFSPSGEPPFHISQDTYDVFGVLSHLAAVTDSIDIGTNTCIVPYRHPVVLARNALTVEALSGGSFDFGVAPGWMQTEFEVLDVPFDERGGRTDEFLNIFQQACKKGKLSFDGPYHSFQETGFQPKPADNQPNIWVGGRSGAAFRRVAQFGDGWTIFWSHPDDVASAKNRIMNAWSDFGRRDQPEIAVTRPTEIGTDPDRDSSKPLVGEPEAIANDIEKYVEAGTTRIVIDFYTTNIDEQVEQIRRFGDDVVDVL